MAHEVLEVCINGSQLLVFTGNPDQSMKDDVLDSTLYTQLAANQQAEKFDDFPKWQDILLNALSKFGWLRLDTTNVDEAPACDTFIPAKLFTELLPAPLQQAQGENVRMALTQLFSSPANAQAAGVLKQGMLQTSMSKGASGDDLPVSAFVMQLGIVLPTWEKVSLHLAFQTREPSDDNPFNQCFSTHQLIGNLTYSRLVCKFDEIRYLPMRGPVSKALKDKKPRMLHPVAVVGK